MNLKIKMTIFILILILIANSGFVQNGIIRGYVFDNVFGIKLIGYKDTTVNNVVVEPGKDLILKFFLSECEYHILGHPTTCPICGKTDEVVPILYGVATKKMIKKEKKGLAFIGGARTGCDPVYYCKKDKVKF